MPYGARHQDRELESARNVCQALGLPLRLLSIPDYLLKWEGSALTGDRTPPQCRYEDLPVGLSPAYVPFRNGLLISLAVAEAFRTGCEQIQMAVHAEDSERSAYPDCSPEFITQMAQAVSLGTGSRVSLLAPFNTWLKSDVVALGSLIEAPMNLSWSCYEGGATHCGRCSTCRARRLAFQKAVVPDSTEYEVIVDGRNTDKPLDV